MNLDNPGVQAICALLPGVIYVSISLYRHRGLQRTVAGGFFVALTSGFAIPKGLFLCEYLFSPDYPQITSKLHGYEREIFAAGAIVVFLAAVSIWSLWAEAYSSTPVPPPHGPSHRAPESESK
jgi:hypothetical protein